MAPPATQGAEPRPPLAAGTGEPRAPLPCSSACAKGRAEACGVPSRGVRLGGSVLLAGNLARAFRSPGALSGPVKIINFPRLALERAREHIPVIYNLAVCP